MAITRSLSDGRRLVDWTDEIINVGHLYGMFNGMGLFRAQGVSQTAIVFDKSYHDTTLLPQVNRRAQDSTKGVDRSFDTFSLPLAYFKHSDYITAEDVQAWRQVGSPEAAHNLAQVRAQKLEDMRNQVDQTFEYMKLQAVKGVCKSPDGKIVADMFSEFSIVRPEVDFVLGTSTTNVDQKIAEVKRGVSTALKTGGVISGIDFIVDQDFFDKLINHPQIRESYLHYQNNGSQRLRDDYSTYMSWGVMDMFEHRGVRFLTYDATFKLPNGTTEDAITDGEGFIIVHGPRDLYRGYYGPSNKLSGANAVGREMFAYEYTDPKDEFHEMQVETAPLFFMTQPQVAYKIFTSN
jgi:hypothetical protein